MPEEGYDSTFALITPEAPGIYTFAVAALTTGEAKILLLIETLYGSERHFWDIAMAKHQLEQLRIQIEMAEKKADLTVVQNPTKLILPGQT